MLDDHDHGKGVELTIAKQVRASGVMFKMNYFFGLKTDLLGATDAAWAIVLEHL